MSIFAEHQRWGFAPGFGLRWTDTITSATIEYVNNRRSLLYERTNCSRGPISRLRAKAHSSASRIFACSASFSSFRSLFRRLSSCLRAEDHKIIRVQWGLKHKWDFFVRIWSWEATEISPRVAVMPFQYFCYSNWKRTLLFLTSIQQSAWILRESVVYGCA